MNLFKHQGNDQPEIGYSFISSAHFIYLVFPLFLIIFIFPGKSLAQYGKISGYVYKYSNNAPLSGVTVSAFSADGQVRGSDDTGSSGYYEITLDPGSYSICARKTGYVWECYQQPQSSGPDQCSGKDCGYFWVQDPNELSQGDPIVVLADQTTTNKKFYLARAGNIEGNISGANDNYSYRGIYFS